MELHINIRNFKSIKNTDLQLKKGVNILIGPNSSGKTCILLALKFIRDIFLEEIGRASCRERV